MIETNFGSIVEFEYVEGLAPRPGVEGRQGHILVKLDGVTGLTMSTDDAINVVRDLLSMLDEIDSDAVYLACQGFVDEVRVTGREQARQVLSDREGSGLDPLLIIAAAIAHNSGTMPEQIVRTAEYFGGRRDG